MAGAAAGAAMYPGNLRKTDGGIFVDYGTGQGTYSANRNLTYEQAASAPPGTFSATEMRKFQDAKNYGGDGGGIAPVYAGEYGGLSGGGGGGQVSYNSGGYGGAGSMPTSYSSPATVGLSTAGGGRIVYPIPI